MRDGPGGGSAGERETGEAVIDSMATLFEVCRRNGWEVRFAPPDSESHYWYCTVVMGNYHEFGDDCADTPEAAMAGAIMRAFPHRERFREEGWLDSKVYKQECTCCREKSERAMLDQAMRDWEAREPERFRQK